MSNKVDQVVAEIERALVADGVTESLREATRLRISEILSRHFAIVSIDGVPLEPVEAEDLRIDTSSGESTEPR